MFCCAGLSFDETLVLRLKTEHVVNLIYFSL